MRFWAIASSIPPRAGRRVLFGLYFGAQKSINLDVLCRERMVCGLLRVDGWSIHRGLDLYFRGYYYPLVLFLIFILPVWVDLYFVEKLVRFIMSPVFLCIFFLFLIIYL